MPVAKWFPKLTSNTPLASAARAVIAARAATLLHFLRLVRDRSSGDPEHVHQLRVATRRLGSAISIFEPCLGASVRRELRHATRKLRRAASRSRDLDVQQALLKSRCRAAQLADESVVAGVCQAFAQKRQRLERKLSRTARRWAKPIQELAARAVATLGARAGAGRKPPLTLRQAAGVILERRLRKFRVACGRDLDDLDNLHKLRIAAKRLRYAMEVFAACFPRQFRTDLYAEVERTQDELGDINDLRHFRTTVRRLRAVTKRSLKRHGKSAARPLRELRESAERELQRRKATFLKRWTNPRQARFLLRFTRLLATTHDRD